MKTCTKCGQKKRLNEFYMNQGKPRSRCKPCHNKSVSSNVRAWRNNAKRVLFEEHGGSCMDCGFVGPPFMFDFDHRDPSQKSFEINSGNIRSIASMRNEASKCDLVCANCHRIRTHKQRCEGCEYC